MSIGQSSPGWAPVDAGLRQYLETIRRFPMLSREEESRLARLVREEGDRAAADTLITSHLRLVGVSRQRIRQIEMRAFEKLRAAMTEAPGPGVAAPYPLRHLGRRRATLRDPAMEATGHPPVAAA